VFALPPQTAAVPIPQPSQPFRFEEARSAREVAPPRLLQRTRTTPYLSAPQRPSLPLQRIGYHDSAPVAVTRAPRTILISNQLTGIAPEVRQEIQRTGLVTYQVVHAQPRGCVEFYGVSGLSIGLHSNGRPAYLGQVCEGDDAVVPPLKDVTALRATYPSQAALRVFFCPADENPLGFSDLEGGAAY
jgi:hypothetical protein